MSKVLEDQDKNIIREMILERAVIELNGIEDITDDSKLQDFMLDDLDNLEILCDMEREFSITIDDQDADAVFFNDESTVADLFKLVTEGL